MPTVRRIELSDRRLVGAMPQTRVFQPTAGAAGARAIGQLGDDLSRTVPHVIDAINRVKDNDARIAVTQWETAIMRGLNGTDVTDETGNVTHIPGIAQKTWEDYRREGPNGSPIADLAKVEEAFQATDTYRNMDSITRRKFDRMVALKREGYRKTVNGLHDRNRIAEDRFWDTRAIQNADEKLNLSFCEDDEAFEKMSEEVAKDKLAIAYKRMDLNDERVGAAWKRDFAALKKESALKRVGALADLGAQGDTKIVGGKLESGQADLDRASAYLAKMTESGVFSRKEASDLGFRIVQAQARLDNRIQGELRNFSANAIANGELPGIQDTYRMMNGFCSMFKPGSESHTVALAEAKRLDAEADKEVERIIENDLLAGKKLTMSDGKTLIYDPKKESDKRFVKLYPSVKARIDEMRRKDEMRMREDNYAGILYDEMMLDYEIQSGTLTDDALAKRKRDIYDRARAMAEGLMLNPKDAVAFGKSWDARNKADESAAAVDFDRAFGLSLTDFADARGNISTEVTDSGYKKAVRSGQKAIFPGTDEKVSLGEYLKMRASFLERLRALPANADRRQETAKLLEEFKGGWYARQTEANIDALARTMNDIHLGIEAEVEAERLRAAAEEERRNMPVVDRRHPANAEPQPDPLEFYRLANPLGPTLIPR